jgi:hypothetical protein
MIIYFLSLLPVDCYIFFMFRYSELPNTQSTTSLPHSRARSTTRHMSAWDCPQRSSLRLPSPITVLIQGAKITPFLPHRLSLQCPLHGVRLLSHARSSGALFIPHPFLLEDGSERALAKKPPTPLRWVWTRARRKADLDPLDLADDQAQQQDIAALIPVDVLRAGTAITTLTAAGVLHRHIRRPWFSQSMLLSNLVPPPIAAPSQSTDLDVLHQVRSASMMFIFIWFVLAGA